MKSSLLFAAACLALVPFKLPAATTHYVVAGGTNAVPPYTNCVTAATNIQDAVDVAANGDIVLVTNGIYATGGQLYAGMTNRVTIINTITLKSINGPGVTVIQGYPVIGTNAVRCVWLITGALLSGFTITNGATLGATGDSKTSQDGGGVYCATSGSVISNCVVSGNAAYGWGGGVDGGTLWNCKLYGNTAGSGGGADFANLNNCALFGNSASSSGGGAVRGTLNNCTLVGNTASAGGGVDGGSDGILNNCIIYSNTAAVDPNYTGIYTYHFSLNYCCTVPMPTNGVGNITNDPAFLNLTNRDFHLQATSRCINTGNNSNVTDFTDLDGNVRIMGGTVDMGAYENETPIRCVDINNTAPAAPYINWSTAATRIQDAIDVSTNGDLIWVNDGVYQDGFRTNTESISTNRVVVNKTVTIRSLNGPSAAIINGGGIYRCVYLTNGATLSGFTLTNGAAGWVASNSWAALPYTVYADDGGGVVGGWFGGGVVSNCVLTGNSATGNGGGASGVILLNCVLNGNQATNGGGAANSTLLNCIVISNSVPFPGKIPSLRTGDGGGIYGGIAAVNCLIVGNSAYQGGGTWGTAQLINCTIVSNTAAFDGGIGFGQSSSQATNCIIYFNLAGTNANYGDGQNYISHCCTTPMPTSGQGNITNAPTFVNFQGGDYYLAPDSLLINSGMNSVITNSTDLDGNPRIVGGTVDIGAYEYQSPTTVLSRAWARQYGFPTDGSADYADPDRDGMNNWQEFMAGTNPTNANSVLAMTLAYPYNNTYFNWHWAIVKWQSVSTRTYYLLRSSDLGSGFTCIQCNIVGTAGTTTYQDTTATNGGPYFYRVGVQ